ncbi:MAG: hypothetical protein V3V96_15475 [Acidiferrobacterales bacterium]
MYEQHQPIISRYGRSDPESMARVLQFVILSAHVRLANVPINTETAAQGGEEALGVLFAWKFDAYNNVWDRREAIHSYLEFVACHARDERALAIDIIDYVARLPGFGLVKAGFAAQLLYDCGGCLDSHNLRRFNLSVWSFSHYSRLRSVAGRKRKVEHYVDTVYQCGGPGSLWDSWCEYVSARQPNAYPTADHASKLHCTALQLTA